MTLLQWIWIGLGGVLLLAGAIVLLIGILKKKNLFLWKILPGAVAVGGVVLAVFVWMGYLTQVGLVNRENYVAWRLAELDGYQESVLAAESAYSRMANSQSAQLATLGLALDKQYEQGQKMAARYQKTFSDATLEKIGKLCEDGANGKSVGADLLMIHKEIGRSISISDGEKDKAESIVNIQLVVKSGSATSLDHDLENLMYESDPLSKKASALGYAYQGDSQMAYEELEAAANQDPAFPSRSLLAQMKAEGYEKEQPNSEEMELAERQKLEEQTQALRDQIVQLQEKISQTSESNKQEIRRLQAEISKLEKEIQQLYDDVENEPIRKAVDYILSSKPQEQDQIAYNLTLSQLYFRSGDTVTAEEKLKEVFTLTADDASGYLSAEVYNLLEAYDNSQRVEYTQTNESMENEGEEVPEEETVANNDPEAAIQRLLSAYSQNLTAADVTYNKVTTDVDGNQIETPVSFSQFILETLRDVRAGLHIGTVDTTKYPEISVTVNISQTREESYKKEDFTVKEQGKEIGDFELIDTSEENTGSNVCLVVDHSGSMEGTNLEQAKKAVAGFIQTTGSDMKTGLVAFDDTAKILTPVTESTGTVQRAVDQLTADGGTHIANGLLAGIENLNGQSGNRIIILLSDGEDGSDSMEQMDQVINLLVQQGITVYAVGFDFADSAYLTRICEATGGKFLRAETSDSLGSVYQMIERFLSQDYIIRFTVQEDDKAYDRDLRISMAGGVYDEKDYFVGVSPERIEMENGLTPSSDYFQQTGGSYQASRGPEAGLAFQETVQEYQQSLGAGETVKLGKDVVQNVGLSVVRMIDFDGDGDKEILLGYSRDTTSEPKSPEDYRSYYEIWGWKFGQAQRLYNGDVTYTDKGWQSFTLYQMDNQYLLYTYDEWSDEVEYFQLKDGEFVTYLSARGNIQKESKECYLNGEKVSAKEQKAALDALAKKVKKVTYSFTQKKEDDAKKTLEETQNVLEELNNWAVD